MRLPTLEHNLAIEQRWSHHQMKRGQQKQAHLKDIGVIYASKPDLSIAQITCLATKTDMAAVGTMSFTRTSILLLK